MTVREVSNLCKNAVLQMTNSGVTIVQLLAVSAPYATDPLPRCK